MMKEQNTIVLVLRSGKDFAYRDVELITRHILGKWLAKDKPRIICMFDKVTQHYDLGSLQLIPLGNNWAGTWARMSLYSPAMEQYRPFLYIDLDTAVISSLENIFYLVKDKTQFITLEDFYQKGQLATGLVWVPAKSDKVKKIWKAWKGKEIGKRMDFFLRKVLKPDLFWQQLTDTIHDFKPKKSQLLREIPEQANLICFHGNPRIHELAKASMSIPWVKEYVAESFIYRKATVIISYKEDRGWLLDAISSVPEGVQLILSQGSNGFSADFNKVLPQVEGEYVKYLHDDDMLTPNCIEDSIRAIEDQGVDFIHGDVFELKEKTGTLVHWKPPIKKPTLEDLLKKNTLHSASMMYRKEVFDKVGGFKEGLDSSEDYEFNLRCLKAGLTIGYCPAILAYYRRHNGQKVRTTKTVIQNKTREMIKNTYK